MLAPVPIGSATSPRRPFFWVGSDDARLTGLEPATPRLTAWCSNQLSYSPIFALPRKDSNLRRSLVNGQALCHLSYEGMGAQRFAVLPVLARCQPSLRERDSNPRIVGL